MPEITLDYQPRAQFEEFHSRSNRWSCIVAHRRAGKTVACINDVVTRATYTQKKNARYAYIAPFYRQAKDVAWVYLKEATEQLMKPGAKPRESELRVELFNGAWITLYGADNPDALRGLYFDGVILDEYGDCRPSLWGEVILPTLNDRKGWAIFIGTPKGHNHFWEIKKRAQKEDTWFFEELKASKTGIIDQEELKEIRAQLTEDQFNQEYECDFDAAVQGTYFANILQEMSDDRFGVFPHDPDQPVHVAADLGFTDSSAYWFWQNSPDGPVIIDYEEAHSEPLQYYFDLLNYKSYEYEEIWLPHDARAKSLQTGRSTIEQFLDAGFPCNIAPKLSLQHGIDAARLVLPKCHFNVETTNDGIEGLRAYRRQYNEITKAFTDKPLHDWSSHPSDAFRYFALVMRESIAPSRPKQSRPVFEAPKYTLNDLFEDRESDVLSVANIYRRGY